MRNAGLLSAGGLHFQQAEPVVGKGRGDLHHASTGGCPDKRHDAEVIHVLGNDVAAIHFAVGTELLESLEVACSGGLGAVFYLEGDEAAFDGGDDVHFLVFAAFPARSAEGERRADRLPALRAARRNSLGGEPVTGLPMRQFLSPHRG